MTTVSNELTQYLEWVNETRQTMKIGSEQFMVSPPAHILRENDRFVRRLIASSLLVHQPSDDLLDRQPLRRMMDDVESWYWGEARRGAGVSLDFGATDHAHVSAHFQVDVMRAWPTRVRSLRDAHPGPSLTNEFLHLIDSVAEQRSTTVPQACRVVMTELSRRWSATGNGARSCEAEPEKGLREALREAGSHQWSNVPRERRGRVGRDYYDGTAYPLLTSESEVREFAAAYALGRLGYNTREMELAQLVASDPRLQYALLAFHSVVTIQARAVAAPLVQRYGDPRVLLPFTEICVDANRYRSSSVDLVPNPKLITVLTNNVVPAISGVMARDQVSLDGLNGSLIREGVASAVSRGIFEVRVGAFNRAEPKDQATLDGMTLRVCPARDPFAQMCQAWLPFLFDRYPG